MLSITTAFAVITIQATIFTGSDGTTTIRIANDVVFQNIGFGANPSHGFGASGRFSSPTDYAHQDLQPRHFHGGKVRTCFLQTAHAGMVALQDGRYTHGHACRQREAGISLTGISEPQPRPGYGEAGPKRQRRLQAAPTTSSAERFCSAAPSPKFSCCRSGSDLSDLVALYLLHAAQTAGLLPPGLRIERPQSHQVFPM
jgi:hypothetical protein